MLQIYCLYHSDRCINVQTIGATSCRAVKCNYILEGNAAHFYPGVQWSALTSCSAVECTYILEGSGVHLHPGGQFTLVFEVNEKWIC